MKHRVYNLVAWGMISVFWEKFMPINLEKIKM